MQLVSRKRERGNRLDSKIRSGSGLGSKSSLAGKYRIHASRVRQLDKVNRRSGPCSVIGITVGRIMARRIATDIRGMARNAFSNYSFSGFPESYSVANSAYHIWYKPYYRIPGHDHGKFPE